MKRPLALTKLIRVFDRLFDNVDASKKIVFDAGIEDGYIKYSTASLTNWTNIVNAALRQDALDRLVDTACAEREDARPELQNLLRLHKAWAKHNPTLVQQLVANDKPPTFAEIFRVQISIVLSFLVIAVTFAVYWFCGPSGTSLTVTGAGELSRKDPDDPRGKIPVILMKAANRGGRSSTLTDHYVLTFPPQVPLKPQELHLLEGATRIVPGHRDVEIRLFASGLDQILPSDGSHLTGKEAVKRLRGRQLTLHYKISESSGTVRRSIPFRAELVETFVENNLPE